MLDRIEYSFTTCAIFLLVGLFMGMILMNIYYIKKLERVGISKLQNCHNSYSNWTEIVWIEKDTTKK